MWLSVQRGFSESGSSMDAGVHRNQENCKEKGDPTLGDGELAVGAMLGWIPNGIQQRL